MTSKASLLLFLVLCFGYVKAQKPPQKSKERASSFYDASQKFIKKHQNDGEVGEGGTIKDTYRMIEEWGPRLWPHGDANIASGQISTYAAESPPCSNVDVFTEGPFQGLDLGWRHIGLNGNDRNGSFYKNSTGQIHRLAFPPGFGTPAVGKTMYAATGFGGLWRTEDDGQSWHVVNTDNQIPLTSVADVAVDPNNGNNIYIVTGYADRSGFNNIAITPNGSTNPYWTVGVFRSMDYGETWQCISQGYLSEFQNKSGVARRILINPDNPDQIFIATSRGVFRTNNAKANTPFWEKVYVPYYTDGGIQYQDTELRGLEFKPGDPSTVYVSGKDIYVSKSGGDAGTWEEMSGPNASFWGYSGLDFDAFSTNPGFTRRRINLATSELDPDRLYAYIVGEDCKPMCYIFLMDNTNIWQERYEYHHPNSDLGNMPGEAWNAIEVSKVDKDIVYFGGTKVWKVDITPGKKESTINDPINSEYTHCGIDYDPFETVGEATVISAYNDGSFHADVHDLAIHPSFPNDMYCGNHGGVSKKDLNFNNISGWTRLTNGLEVGTIWDFDSPESNEAIVVVSNQDNGVNVREQLVGDPSPIWDRVQGGDGFAIQFDNRYRTSGYWGNNGTNVYDVTFNYFNTNTLGNNTSSVNPTNQRTLLDKNCYNGTDWCLNPKQFRVVNHPVTGELYYGRSEIQKRTDSPSHSWENVSDIYLTMGLNGNGWQKKVQEFEIAPSNPDYIYVLMVGAPEFNQSTRLFRSTTGFVEPDPNGGRGPQQFFDISASLPTITTAGTATNHKVILTDIVVDPTNHLRLWATVTGYHDNTFTYNRVIYSPDGGNSWQDWDVYYEIPFPVNTIVYQEGTNDRLIIGCDNGLYVKEGGQFASWFHITEFPNVRVNKLEISKCTGKLRAATFGRGLWEGTLPNSKRGLDRELVISSNTTWSSEVYQTQNIRITSGAELTITNTLNMPKRGKIIVEPGCKLIVNGGKITNACNEMWQGIEVVGNRNTPQNYGNQGTLRLLNGAIIEYAYNAVATKHTNSNGGYSVSTTGGIIEASRSFFINNKRDVELLSYHNRALSGEIANISYFIDCQFERNDDYKETSIFGHITMWDVNGIRIQGSKFEDKRTDIPDDQESVGIFTMDAAYEVTPFIEQPSEFINLRYGINSTGLNNANQFSITVRESEFDCRHGILLNTISYPRIENNTIFTEVDPDGNLNEQRPDYSFPYGIYLNTCYIYTVEGNSLSSNSHGEGLSVGIVVRNMHSRDEAININNISDYTVGVEAIGQNKHGTISSLGLKIRCNEFRQNQYDIYVTDDLQRPINNSTVGIAVQQGTATKPAGNLFSQNPTMLISNIENQGGALINYTHHDPGLEPRVIPPVTSPGVFLISSATPYDDGCGPGKRLRRASSTRTDGDIVTEADIYTEIFSMNQQVVNNKKGSTVINIDKLDISLKAKEDYRDFISLNQLLDRWEENDVSLNELSDGQIVEIKQYTEASAIVANKALGILAMNTGDIDDKPVYIPITRGQNRNSLPEVRISQTDEHLKVYPNPASKQFTIDYKVEQTTEQLTVRIVDVAGKSVYQHVALSNNDQLQVNIENMPSGLYFCQLIANDAIIFTEKINIIR